MISQKVLTRGDAGNASVIAQIDSYYQDKKDDYYAKEEQPSQWQGKLAEELNLSGEVSKVDFVMLMQGKHNGVDLRKSKYTKKDNKDRLGIDLTFNAPKSVSLQALVGGDKRLIDAHNQAVKDTLAEIEKNADTRIKEKGKTRLENTGKLAIATFRHDTNRNNEPHLHTHSVVINFTKRQDGEYRALHNDRIVKNVKEYTAMYQANLAKRAKELGYNIRHNSNGTFDLAHITKEQIEAFSTRSKEIEIQLEKDKLSRETATTEQKNAATLMTRKRKDKDIDKEAVKENWLEQASKLNIELSPVVLNDKNTETRPVVKNSVSTNFEIAQNIFENMDNEIISLSQVKNISEIESIKSNNINVQNMNINIVGFNRDLETKELQHDRRNDNSNTRNRGDNSDNQSQGEAKEHSYNSHSNASNELLYGELWLQAELNSATSGASKAERPNYMSNMSSSPMVQEKGSINVSLSYYESEHMGQQRTEYNSRLRWSNDSYTAVRRIDNDINHEPEPTQQQSQSNGEDLEEILSYDLPDEELIERWNELSKEIDFSTGEVINEEQSLDDILELVIEHITDKKVEITEKELREQLLVKGQGIVDYNSIDGLIGKAIEEKKIIYADTKYKIADDKTDKNAISYSDWVKRLTDENTAFDDAVKMVDKTIEKGRLVKTQDIYVTPQHLEDEKNIINKIKYSKKLNAIIDKEILTDYLENTNLNEGQKKAASLILNSHEQILGVQGYAGTGKSYMLKTALNLAESNGKDVVLLAPYSNQVKSLKQDGLDANTLASFLMSKKRQEAITENSVIIVDESGVVDTKQMAKLVKIADQKNAKIVLLGDTAQTKAIGAGSPFDLMQKNGMRMAVMDDIQRQKNDTLKQAVLYAVNDDTDKAIQNLKTVYEIENKDTRHNAVAEKYTNLPEKDRANTIVVSGTNADREDINNKIREKLGVAGQGVIVEQLKRTEHSDPELKMIRSFEVGQVLEFNYEQKKLNVTKGQGYEIIEKSNNEIFIKDDLGKKIPIVPKQTALSLYDKKEIEISKGDILRVTKSNKDLDQATGDIYKVVKLNKEERHAFVEDSKGGIKKVDLKRKNHLDHAYAMTVHSSQGTTVDNVIVNLDTKSRTTNKEVFYVAISRARHEAHIYTDNQSKLPDAVRQATIKNNATDLVKANNQITRQGTKGRSYEELKNKEIENVVPNDNVNKVNENQIEK